MSRTFHPDDWNRALIDVLFDPKKRNHDRGTEVLIATIEHRAREYEQARNLVSHRQGWEGMARTLAEKLIAPTRAAEETIASEMTSESERVRAQGRLDAFRLIADLLKKHVEEDLNP